MLLVASCYRKRARDKLRPDGPLAWLVCRFNLKTFVVIVFLCYFVVTDKTTACEAVTTWFNAQPQGWTMLDCNIECCTGDRCNDQPVSVLPVDPSDDPTVVASHASYQAPVTVALALAITRFLAALCLQ